MRFTIENEFLSLEIAELGAEMKSLRSKKTGREWLWQADPDFWPRTAPVLFPIVGKLVEDQYLYKGHPYPLSQHGFARDRVFSLVEHSDDNLTFQLDSDYESQKFYPFEFQLRINYRLIDNKLNINYWVKNTGSSSIFFSIGGHPGFSLPGFPSQAYELEFEKPESKMAFPLKRGLLEMIPNKTVFNGSPFLPLTESIFDEDALVFQGLESNWIAIKEIGSTPLLKVHFSGFPWAGIWAKPGAPFVCIEPWFGHADWVGEIGEIESKHAIQNLDAGRSFACGFQVEICQPEAPDHG